MLKSNPCNFTVYDCLSCCHVMLSYIKCLCWSLGHAEQLLFSCLCSEVTVYDCLSCCHVMLSCCHMSSAYVDHWDMVNNFCFHVYAQKSLFIIIIIIAFNIIPFVLCGSFYKMYKNIQNNKTRSIKWHIFDSYRGDLHDAVRTGPGIPFSIVHLVLCCFMSAKYYYSYTRFTDN